MSANIWDGMQEDDSFVCEEGSCGKRPARSCGCGKKLCAKHAEQGKNHTDDCTHHD